MPRVHFIAAATVATMSAALAGCSSMSAYVPDWMSFHSGPTLQTLQFESSPPGAVVRTAQGQTCIAPCALAVQPSPQAVTFALDGFLPQTVQVDLRPGDSSGALMPNPVVVTLQSVPPPVKPMIKPKPRPRPKPKPKPMAAPPAGAGAPPGTPPEQQPAQPETSPFPPPPGGTR
jgi:hypothetical protein